MADNGNQERILLTLGAKKKICGPLAENHTIKTDLLRGRKMQSHERLQDAKNRLLSAGNW